jgi:hypothetical protein
MASFGSPKLGGWLVAVGILGKCIDWIDRADNVRDHFGWLWPMLTLSNLTG